MGLFSEMREAGVKAPEQEPEVVVEEPSLAESLVREAAPGEPCYRCSCGVPCPIVWESVYGEYHCAGCSWPKFLSMVKRVAVYVAVDDPANYCSTAIPGVEYDLVERPDYLENWKQAELRRARLKREAREAQASDGY